MFLIGSRLFGKVDVVPGAFHVATRFWHVNFLPLIPVGSFVVLPGGARGFELGAIRWGSATMAWARAALVLCAAALAFGALADRTAAPGRAWLLAALAVACGVAFAATYRLGRATAEELKAVAGYVKNDLPK